MTELLRPIAEKLARKTTRRGLFGQGAEIATGALLGAAVGTLMQADRATAGGGTVCGFPGPPCPCEGCNDTGVCAKPCIILTTFYASGCWVAAGVTCCDCDCLGLGGSGSCGCGSDYHNDPGNCAGGKAQG